MLKYKMGEKATSRCLIAFTSPQRFQYGKSIIFDESHKCTFSLHERHLNKLNVDL